MKEPASRHLHTGNLARLKALRALKAQQTAGTRSNILRSALRLFNELGSASVSTHDIAKAAGISPGNLYYHFKNKEEIIREIFYGMDLYSSDKWYQQGPVNPKVTIMDFMRFFLGNLWNYRFFFREFSLLLLKDPVLARGWRHSYERLTQAMRMSAQNWVEQGILKPFAGTEERDAFIENAWIIANFAWVQLETGKSSSQKSFHEQGIRLLLHYLYPYHTQKGQKALELHLR